MQLKYILTILAIITATSAGAQTYYDQQRQARSYQAQHEATVRAYSAPAYTYKPPSSSSPSSYSSNSSSYSPSRSNNSSYNVSRQSGTTSSSTEQTRIPENMKWHAEDAERNNPKAKPDCQGDCSETLTYYGGTATYTGNTKGGQANGRGVLTLTDGRKFTGNWIDGQLSGESKILSANGDRYEGGYSNRAMNGWGRYTYSNGDYMEGNWVNNTRVGKGTNNMGGYIDNGVWDAEGKAEGYHTFEDKAGNIVTRYMYSMTGTIPNIIDKWGISNYQYQKPTATSQTFPNGTVYVGEVYDGKPYSGKYTFKNGGSFEGLLDQVGFYVHGKKTGADGDVFEGEFKEGRTYRGTYRNKGNIFMGEFAGDHDDNYKVGRMIFADGAVQDRFYVRNNSKDGYLKTRFPNGMVNESMYNAGKLTGGVMIVFASGSTFTGMGDHEGYALYGIQNFKDGSGDRAFGRNADGQWTELPEADNSKAVAAAAKGKEDVERGRALYREAVKFNPELAP